MTKSCASQPRITSTPELNHADNVHFLSLSFYSSAHFRRLGIEEYFLQGRFWIHGASVTLNTRELGSKSPRYPTTN